MSDRSGAVEQPTSAVSPTQPGLPDAAPPEQHKVDRGPRLQLGPDGRRWYLVSCLCGWESEPSGTAVLAEAAAEQHVTFARGSRRTRR